MHSWEETWRQIVRRCRKSGVHSSASATILQPKIRETATREPPFHIPSFGYTTLSSTDSRATGSPLTFMSQGLCTLTRPLTLTTTSTLQLRTCSHVQKLYQTGFQPQWTSILLHVFKRGSKRRLVDELPRPKHIFSYIYEGDPSKFYNKNQW